MTGDLKERIYVSSKIWYVQKWLNLRDIEKWPIISTWIDESNPGDISDFSDAWYRYINEVRTASGLILFSSKKGETLKGSLVETGAALGTNIPVAIVGTIDGMKTAKYHPLVGNFTSLNEARRWLYSFIVT